MKKIPTLFVRDEVDRKYVTDEFAVELPEGSEPTLKLDGTCVMFDGGWWFRREIKPGADGPEGWVEVGTDEVTGKRVGWEPAVQSGFFKYLAEAIHERLGDREFAPQLNKTYELLGPKINGNPTRRDRHWLYPHGTMTPKDLHLASQFWRDGMNAQDIKTIVANLPDTVEGIVWWFNGEPVAKLKKRDIRPVKENT